MRLPGEVLGLIPAWYNLYNEYQAAALDDGPLARAIESFRGDFFRLMDTVKEIKGERRL